MISKNRTGSLCTKKFRDCCVAVGSIMSGTAAVGLTGVPAVITVLLVVGGLYFLTRL